MLYLCILDGWLVYSMESTKDKINALFASHLKQTASRNIGSQSPAAHRVTTVESFHTSLFVHLSGNKLSHVLINGQKRRGTWHDESSVASSILLTSDIANWPNLIILSAETTVVSVAFGAVHVLAWNYSFPSKYESWVWRIAPVVVIALPFVGIAVFFIVLNRDDYLPGIKLWYIGYVLLAIYILARLAVVGVMFSCFRWQPADVYKAVRWATYFPHFGS